jgi:hypothetical protein
VPDISLAVCASSDPADTPPEYAVTSSDRRRLLVPTQVAPVWLLVITCEVLAASLPWLLAPSSCRLGQRWSSWRPHALPPCHDLPLSRWNVPGRTRAIRRDERSLRRSD